MDTRLTDYKVLSFDCYGTLIDWETGIWDALQPLIAHTGLDSLTREDALALFGRTEMTLEQAHPGAPYDEILRLVHAAMAAELNVRSAPSLNEAFGESVAHWPAFADTAPALRELRKHFALVILSNVHRRGFEASNRKLGVTFDAIYTAEDIGSYKPSDRNFHYLLDHLERDLGFEAAQLMHTAQSLVHDHVPANRFGIANTWIDRQRHGEDGSVGATGVPAERPALQFVFRTLGDMARAVAAEKAAG